LPADLTGRGIADHSKAMIQADPTDIPIRMAATLVIVKDGVAGSAPQLLMAERASSMAFAAGAMVFPGGAVDDADKEHAQLLDLPFAMEDAAARIAAVRETIEECGLGVAAQSYLARNVIEDVRRSLAAGESFAHCMRIYGLEFDFEALTPFARWCPPADRKMKRYDTRFYIARADKGHEPPVADGSETAALGWYSAQQVLDYADAGKAKIIFPTRRNLERIAQHGTIDALLDHARAHPVELVTPWTEERNGELHLCIPEGLGYPVTSQPVVQAVRGD